MDGGWVGGGVGDWVGVVEFGEFFALEPLQCKDCHRLMEVPL